MLKKICALDPSSLEIAEKLEQLRALYIGGDILVLEADEVGIGVDTPQDVEYVERVMRKLGMVS